MNFFYDIENEFRFLPSNRHTVLQQFFIAKERKTTTHWCWINENDEQHEQDNKHNSKTEMLTTEFPGVYCGKRQCVETGGEITNLKWPTLLQDNVKRTFFSV